MITRRLALQGAALTIPALAQKQSFDLCVYGATPAGIAAAVAAARLGRRVLLVEYEDHIGGIVSNGLTNADIGRRQAVGGFFYEFTRRVVKYYQAMDEGNPEQPNVKLCRDGYWYEANAAEKIFHQMIGEQGAKIQLLLEHELKRAIVESNRLTAIEVESRQDPSRRQTIHANAFVDATYEGDLAAMSGAPFRTGREAKSEYNEPHAGKIYMRFRENTPLPGSTGEADNATQAYCFRFHVTNVPEKRLTIQEPVGYNRDDYRFVLEDIRAGLITTFRQVIQVYPMPNGRFELNSDHVNPTTGIPKESLDLAEECWPWPTATPAQRRKIYERYRTHNVGLIWLLQNDPEVPEALRQDARQYGWHKDEFTKTGGIPRQVYVRQGRRILGDYILTQRDADLDSATSRTKIRRDSIATIEWAFDPHGHHHYDPAHPGVREGYFFVLHEPFQVPYGVLVPRKIENLLVPVACSCSHVAYNALRMEPVFMVLGEACGVAIHLAAKRKTTVRRIPIDQLQAILVQQRGVLTFFEDLPFDHPAFPAYQYLGARGWNTGYKAELNEPLTREYALAALGRVFATEGRRWSPPANASGSYFTANDLKQELRRAGYRLPSNWSTASPNDALTRETCAKLTFQAIAPAESLR